jgi:amino acid permease
MAEYPPASSPDERYGETKQATDLAGIPEDARGHTEHHVAADRLARKLSARQVQMIAIGGTIGTGLFLGKMDSS